MGKGHLLFKKNLFLNLFQRDHAERKRYLKTSIDVPTCSSYTSATDKNRILKESAFSLELPA